MSGRNSLSLKSQRLPISNRDGDHSGRTIKRELEHLVEVRPTRPV